MTATDLLLDLGFSPVHKGTKYLSALIVARIFEPDAKLTALRHIVAKTYNVSYADVERLCRYAYNNAVERAGVERIHEFAGLVAFPVDKFFIGEFIEYCALWLKKKIAAD